MADAYPHALLTEFEPNEVPRLKNKLIKYFQSRKLSGGGDCTVEHISGTNTALIRFRNHQDQRHVLDRDSHLLSLDTGHLSLRVRPTQTQECPAEKNCSEAASSPDRPSPLVHTDRPDEGASLPASQPSSGAPSLGSSASDAPSSKASVLGNLTADMMQEFVEMLVENIMRPASEGITVEMIPALKSAVVSFNTGQENAEFVQRCPVNRTFKSKRLTVRPLEPPTQLLLEETGLNEDILSMFFEKEGAEVETVEVDTDRQSTVITFNSTTDVQKLLQKRLVLRRKELKLYPFHQSLGRALYGSDKPPLKLPAPVLQPVDPALLQFCSSRPTVLQNLHTQLKTHWSQAELDQDGVRLRPEPELLQQQETVIRDWSGTVRSILTQFLSQFEVWKLNPPPDLWKNSLEKVSALLKSQSQVLMVPDETSGVIRVVGSKPNISKLQEPLCESINSLIKRARREKALVTEQIKIKMCVFNLLSQDGLQQKLLSVYPEIKFDTSGPFPKVTGLTEEIANTNKVIYEEMLALKRQNVEVDRYVLEFLKEDEIQIRANAMLSQKNAVFEISTNRIQLLACTDGDLKDAEEHLKAMFISKYVNVEDSNVLNTIEWQQLVDEIEKDNNKGSKKVQIREEEDQVVVSGFNDSVARVSHELDDFLKQNAHIEENIFVNPITKCEYLQQFAKSKIEALENKVKVLFSKDGLSLSGSRANVKDCVGLVKKLVDSVAFETITIVKHGARKVFEDKDENYEVRIASKTGCLVKIVDTAQAKQGIPLASPSSKAVYETQTLDGVKIFVSNADMCSYPVQAIVNPTVEDLQLNSGLAATLSKAAGRQLQVECDKIRLSQGDLKAGNCVATDAGGSLVCRKIIHAVGPKYDKQNVVRVQAQLKRAVKQSLELAEQFQCESLAIPAISRNRNFPLKECAQVIIKAVKEHCEESFGDSSLKSVHFVNNDDAAVAAMEEAVKKEFGVRGGNLKMAAAPAPKPAVASTTSAPSVSFLSLRQVPTSAPVDPNCIGKELTKEGLEFCVMKGFLEQATTDVIVNTVVANLVLTTGAVSNAVLSAAGPSLQAMVQAKQTQGTVGDVIITEGANLNCHMVYHAVAPHYDNGQGTAQKQLSGIFRDCLSKAEASGMTSISFSAMGTGNLGFPRPLVWSLLLESVLDISSKKPKNLKRVQVVLFPKDTQTIQVFSDEFQKKFPKAGGSSTTAPAAPPSGGHFSKIQSTASSHETKLGGVSVQAVAGDITKETTDVIVNSSNDKFSLKSGVSKAILEAAGPNVESECQTLGAQPNDGMILTQPGNLRCKKILHLVGQTDLQKIQTSVKDALQRCIKHNLCSVAFPAIGTGQGNVGARGVADAMFDAVIEVLTKNPGSCLKTVKVVIFQNQMLKDFHDSLQQRVASDTKDKDKAKDSGMLGTLAGKIKSFFTPATPQKTQTPDDFVLEPLKPAPLCFHICGESADKIDAAKKKIDSILAKAIQKSFIKDETILSLSADNRKRLADIQKSAGVGIRVESSNGDGSLSIEGLAPDVLAVTLQINDMLRRARHEEDLNQKAALLSAVVEWQYAFPGQDPQSFDPKTGYELEQALDKKLKEVKVKLSGQEFTVKMPKGPATNRSGTIVNIHRVNKSDFDLPDTWETMDSSSTKVLPVTPGSAEYQGVEQLFKASCNRTITKIERVQNPVLWQSLQIKLRAMDQKNGHNKNTRPLFHGTSADTVALINEHGFNRSYAGKNATAYGKGTYFAVNAQYSSHDTYSRPNANGEKLMYLCSVLTGDFTAGAAGMIEPPLKKAGSIEKYDSVVDNPANPTMFIIFHDSGAYPEYLITFK